MIKRTLFELLLHKKICFAVDVSLSTVSNPMISDNSRYYNVMVLDSDIKGVRNLGFKPNGRYEQVRERAMNEREIEEFRTLQDKFTKVIHNEHGRVYELKGDSFKKKYKELSSNIKPC